MNSGSLNWVQVVGYLASLLVFSTFYMKTMIPLRCVAITSNVAFLTYGYFAGLYPVFILHTVLLPLNVLRLHQMHKLRERVRRSLDRDLSLEWILPFVKRESFKEKEPLFRKGDPADKLYYLERGTVWLPEVERTVQAGQLIGEMGVFSPFKERTGSAVCTTDSTFLVLGERTAIELYYSNPDFGLCMVRTIIRRFLDQQIQGGSRNALKPDPAMSAMEEESPPRGAELDLTQSHAQPRSS